jgi:preprotein translocase subunit SecD
VIDYRRLIAFFLIVVITFAVMGWTSPGILSKIKLGLDLKGGFEILYEASPLEEGQEITPDVLREAAASVESRANASKVAEPDVVPEGTNRIRARLAGVENQEEVRALLKEPVELTFRSSVGCESPTDYCNIEMVGADFVEGGAKVEFDPSTNEPYISIQVKDKKQFENVSRKLLGQQLAIYVGDELESAPTVQGVFTDGSAQITGNYTYQEAEDLKGKINLGALPVKLTEIYTQSVGASLGQLSLEQTVRAGIIGSVVILLFMIVFYRVPGVVACITLITYTWLLLLVFYWMKATLTLPGIAAFILGIGMAVDANIITYERIKEEMRSGKTILSSLKAGSRNSLSTIIDANVTTILAGLVLYYVGTGAIQGFALILILSILVSIITNVFLSRLLLHLLIRAKVVNKPAYFGVKEAEISEL